MSGSGLEDIDKIEIPDGSSLSIAILASVWHSEIVELLIAGAQRLLAKAHVATVDVFRAVGALEIPVVAAQLAQHYDAIVALGVVIQGETPHFDYVCDSVTQGLLRVSLDEKTPIGNGVLTTYTTEQALDRAGGKGASEDKGWQAALAAVDSAITLQQLRSRH